MNVVATLGTALNESHVTSLKRFARRVVLSFDGDRAGQDAARKAVEKFLAQDVDLRILTLPAQLDPAEFLAEKSAEEFRQLVESAPEAWEFQFRSARALYGFETIDGRQRILEEMLDLLAQVPNLSGTLRESLLIANLAQRLTLAETAVRDRLGEVRRQRGRRTRVDSAAPTMGPEPVQIERILKRRVSPEDRLECDLLELLLAAPEHAGFVAQSVSEATLQNSIFRQILEHCLQELDEQGELTLAGLIGRVEDKSLRALIVGLDEQSQDKNLAHKLHDSGYDEDGCPWLLKRLINNLRFRDAEQSHQLVMVQLSQQRDAQGRLDEQTETLLRQAAEFHRKRASQK
jgi:DNA primase